MLPYVEEWAHLLVRLLHITAGIAWIGTSFYYIALDYHLLPVRRREDADRGVGGEVWEIHGGGFYRVEKFKVAPDELPEPLHWFKWEAYTTWLSGFGLLIILYYLNPETYLLDRRVADISGPQAVGISVGILFVGWLVYDGLCRLLGERELLLAAAITAVIALVAWGSSQLFSPRAAYIQVGALIGTWMVLNVFFVIIPGQRQLVAAMLEGKAPDPIHGIRGKQRSVHNNYLTLPVLLAMISNHFPFTYGHQHGWLVLLTMMAISAWLRHFFNLRHRGQVRYWIPASAAAAAALLAFVMAPPAAFAPSQAVPSEPVPFLSVQAVMAQRCTPCHSANPTFSGFTAPPKGVAFDTPLEIQARAPQIYQQTVVTHTMPVGNLTGMSDEERALINGWVRQGAKIE
jgi:uncharacterized membrane protein